jgi:hypothetical protein
MNQDKICPKCKKANETSSSYCSDCLNEYQKSRGYSASDYQKNKSSIKAKFKLLVNVRSDVVHKAKEVPCTDCGIQYPYWIMQFDHVRGKKEFTIGQKLYCCGVKKLLAEIAKCEVVCANCHSNRTYLRGLSK